MRDELSTIADFAARMTREAGAVALRGFRANLTVENKGDDTAVTRADRECEAHMREMIGREFPAHGIVGEEFGAAPRDDTWVLDPIDGTLSFITGSPLFSVLAAFVRDGAPLAGVVHLPAMGETWVGICNGADSVATLNGSPCRVSAARDLRRATCAVTAVDGWGTGGSGMGGSGMGKLLSAAGRCRLGGDGFNYGCVASGYSDMAADCGMMVYDYLAPCALVMAAGGRMTDWRGAPLTLESGKTDVLAACTEEVHRAALSALNS